jgi:hypothetical protein
VKFPLFKAVEDPPWPHRTQILDQLKNTASVQRRNITLFAIPGDAGPALSVQQQASRLLCSKYQCSTAVCGFERFAARMANGLNMGNRVYCVLLATRQYAGPPSTQPAILLTSQTFHTDSCSGVLCVVCLRFISYYIR